MKGRRQILLAIVLLSVSVAAWAQTTDIDTIDANLEKRSANVQQISDRIDAGDVPEATLEDDLQSLLGYHDEIQSDAKALKDAAEEPSRRLADLGPPPAEGEPAELDKRRRMAERNFEPCGAGVRLELRTNRLLARAP